MVERLATLIREIFIHLHRVSKDVVEQEQNDSNSNERVYFSTNLQKQLIWEENVSHLTEYPKAKAFDHINLLKYC